MRTRTYLILWIALAISIVLVVVLAGCSNEPKVPTQYAEDDSRNDSRNKPLNHDAIMHSYFYEVLAAPAGISSTTPFSEARDRLAVVLHKELDTLKSGFGNRGVTVTNNYSLCLDYYSAYHALDLIYISEASLDNTVRLTETAIDSLESLQRNLRNSEYGYVDIDKCRDIDLRLSPL